MQSFDEWFAKADSKKELAKFLRDNNQDNIYLHYHSEDQLAQFSFPKNTNFKQLLLLFPTWLKVKAMVSTPIYYFTESMLDKHVLLLSVSDLETKPELTLADLVKSSDSSCQIKFN